jgi:hypothetical protein
VTASTRLRASGRRLLIIGVAWLGLSAVPSPPSSAQRPRAGDSPSVEVTEFVLASRRGEQNFWRLSFQYAFPGEQQVVLAGVGLIAPTGHLSFLTDRKESRFTDDQGKILRAVALERTATPEGAGIELPAPSDFGNTYHSYTRRRAFLPNECETALNQFFTGGYWPHEEQKVTFYTTAYQALKDGVSPDKRAQVALQVSNPYPAPQRQIAFHVQMKVRERGRGDPDWANSVSDATEQAAERFRGRVVAKLEAVP